MLVLTVKSQSKLQVGDAEIVNLEPKPIRVGIRAPKDLPIRREEAVKKVPAYDIDPRG